MLKDKLECSWFITNGRNEKTGHTAYFSNIVANKTSIQGSEVFPMKRFFEKEGEGRLYQSKKSSESKPLILLALRKWASTSGSQLIFRTIRSKAWIHHAFKRLKIGGRILAWKLLSFKGRFAYQGYPDSKTAVGFKGVFPRSRCHVTRPNNHEPIYRSVPTLTRFKPEIIRKLMLTNEAAHGRRRSKKTKRQIMNFTR